MKIIRNLLILYLSTIGINALGNGAKAMYFSHKMNSNSGNYSKYKEKYNSLADEFLSSKILIPTSVFWTDKSKDITKKLD